MRTDRKKRPVKWIIDNAQTVNIAEKLTEGEILDITNRSCRGYEIDNQSRADWVKKAEFGIKIAEQITESKSFPWDGAANVKYPLIAIAAIQFAARAYPNIINGTRIVKTKTVGNDDDGEKAKKGKRISEHMSWQLLEEMEEWEEDTDKLLHGLPVLGSYFRKTYFDSVLKRNKSESISPMKIVVHNDAADMVTVRRITHELEYYRNEVVEKELDGQFIGHAEEYFTNTDLERDEAELFLEQHRWLDLDGDGYEEPYIVTIHYDSRTLVRIAPCYEVLGVVLSDKDKILKIDKVQYFTKFDFIPSVSGKFYSNGFAHLLGPINESMNTTINQLLDAGTLSNLQGGFIGAGAKLDGGQMQIIPGEWRPVQVIGGTLKDNLVPLPVKPPSTVLFQLLGMLNEAGMRLASVSETMMGDTPSQNTPASTTLAVLEQGLKVFTSIYKRIFRSLTKEFKKVYRLNSIYLNKEQYFTLLDETKKVERDDYAQGNYDIVPVSDPNLSSDAQRLMKAKALLETLDINPTKMGKINMLKAYYEAIDPECVEKYLPSTEISAIVNAKEKPDPDLIEVQLKTIKQKHDSEMEDAELLIKQLKAEVEGAYKKAQTTLTLAQAEAEPIKSSLAVLTAKTEEFYRKTQVEFDLLKQKGEIDEKAKVGSQNGGSGAVAGESSDQTGSSVSQSTPAQPQIGVE